MELWAVQPSPPLPLFLPSLSFSLSFYFSLLLFSSHTHRVTLAVCEASLCPWGVCFYPLINNTMDRVSLSAVWRHLSYWGNVSSSSRRLYLLDSFLLLFFFFFCMWNDVMESFEAVWWTIVSMWCTTDTPEGYNVGENVKVMDVTFWRFPWLSVELLTSLKHWPEECLFNGLHGRFFDPPHK